MNRKGGVGKTTLALMLADTLVGETEQPYNPAMRLVVAVDLDPQASLTRALLYDRTMPTGLGRLKNVLDEKRTLASALKSRLTKSPRRVEEYLTHGVGPTGFTYSLLANESTAWDVERRGLKTPGELKLKAAIRDMLDELAKSYRYVLVDCPPGQTVLAEASIQRSDLVLCPTVPDLLSFWGLESFDKYLQDAFDGHGNQRPPARFVVTKFKRKPPKYDAQNKVFDLMTEFQPPTKYVTLLKEVGADSAVGGKPIALPFDPRLALRLEGAPKPGVLWLWERIYTTDTKAELRRLASAVKKELDSGRSSIANPRN